MSDLITAFFLITGSVFIFIAALGVMKLPTAIMRAHALSKAMLLGISLILLSLIPSLETYAEGIKILLAISFLFLTIPIAGHIFALYSSSEK